MWLNVRGLVQPLAEDFGGLRLQADLDRQRNGHQRQCQDEEHKYSLVMRPNASPSRTVLLP